MSDEPHAVKPKSVKFVIPEIPENIKPILEAINKFQSQQSLIVAAQNIPNYAAPWLEATRAFAESMKPLAQWVNEHNLEIARIGSSFQTARAKLGATLLPMMKRFETGLANLAPVIDTALKAYKARVVDAYSVKALMPRETLCANPHQAPVRAPLQTASSPFHPAAPTLADNPRLRPFRRSCRMQTDPTENPQYAIAASVQLPGVSDAEFEASLTELRELAKTLGFTVVRTFTQKRAGFDSTAYLGVGKRQAIRHFVKGGPDEEAEPDAAPMNPLYRPPMSAEGPDDADDQVADVPIDVIFVDHEISPSQARHLENEVGCQVMDRTMVILEIFHRNARSPAARAQVEIARLGYLAPRLREAAKLAGPQGRQRSGVGGRGAGESHTELDKRKIRDRIAELQREIAAMDADRKTQRARRQGHQSLASVALVGYTNAGKSTLMRALTGSEVLVANKLFATLDTTVRTLYPESVPRVLVSDTVGFIKNLPHGLVASFKSTLEEALDASLLLHVIDASDPGFERQIEATEHVLNEIEALDVPRIRIFNKIDHVGDAAAQAKREAALRAEYPGCIVMSARRPDDVAKLHQAIVAFFQKDLVEAELFLPWSAQQLRGALFACCAVLEEQAGEDGANFRVRGEPAALTALRERLDAVTNRPD